MGKILKLISGKSILMARFYMSGVETLSYITKNTAGLESL
jgi:hypothetical protein